MTNRAAFGFGVKQIHSETTGRRSYHEILTEGQRGGAEGQKK
ncbi:hypothetical protein QNI19_17805 [Cytophagaceae bacterium DM2B3-1]|uniref:Uncharacterized protein n=1 Tax=Xanthocytophaga flava TaxID=3048013 RepID=A0ABT7CQ54_9BACT|nr:hypothetical protein [Xanthocytophaga flavus]MDJ1494799.1 hypothetical protein [Xanthocytophaga flavus]